MNREQSNLLTLLNENKAWELPPWRRPDVGPRELVRIEQAARAHAQVNRSDPFAYMRTKHYLIIGLDRADSVYRAAQSILNARATVEV